MRREAFSLTEMIACLALCGMLCGTALLLPASSWIGGPSTKGAWREAEQIKEWIMRTMSAAMSERASFTLYAPAGRLEDALRISWNGLKPEETWDTDGRYYFFSYRGLSYRSVFSSLYHSMTPAMTIEVRHSGRRRDPVDVYVIISGYGYVTVRETPP